jgi:hypothetical protein
MRKIQRSADGRVFFTVSGRIEAEDVKELRQLLALEAAGQQLVLDLRDVTFVNEAAVKFLASWEAGSIELENCPAYIREWIERVKGPTRRRRTPRKLLSRIASSLSATRRPLGAFRPWNLDDLPDSYSDRIGRIEQFDVNHTCLANSACMPILYSP